VLAPTRGHFFVRSKSLDINQRERAEPKKLRDGVASANPKPSQAKPPFPAREKKFSSDLYESTVQVQANKNSVSFQMTTQKTTVWVVIRRLSSGIVIFCIGCYLTCNSGLASRWNLRHVGCHLVLSFRWPSYL
jgi:hypothetical protein